MPATPYIPQPIDTSQVDLNSLEDLVERLAKNAHEVWAKQRIRDGWTYGPVRDDVRQHHPGLVPYEELPESEKAYDRELVKEALKATMALGFRVVR